MVRLESTAARLKQALIGAEMTVAGDPLHCQIVRDARQRLHVSGARLASLSRAIPAATDEELAEARAALCDRIADAERVLAEVAS